MKSPPFLLPLLATPPAAQDTRPPCHGIAVLCIGREEASSTLSGLTTTLSQSSARYFTTTLDEHGDASVWVDPQQWPSARASASCSRRSRSTRT